MTDGALLELRGITKQYPGVLANDQVSFDVGRGEIHALLGENGAGKSTLVKMIYGVIRPDAGTMRLNGALYAPARPSEARSNGVGMVFQHFSLFEALTVADNIALGISPELAGDDSNGDLSTRIVSVSSSYGLKLDPSRLVGELSVGERQRVEIVRCLLQSPRMMIMDEPTSVLAPHEVEGLFATLRRLAADGCSILYISHKLEEIRSLCGRATVLRGGRVVASCDPAAETTRSLAEMMIGTTLTSPTRDPASIGTTRLEIAGLAIASDHQFGVSLKDIRVEVRAGEIVGIAGVAGNGQSELMEALIGELRAESADAIKVDGQGVGLLGPNARRAMGMCFVPEERLGHGAVPDMSLSDNTILSAAGRKRMTRGGFLNVSVAVRFAEEIVAQFAVRTAGVEHMARSLSGGNLQKFVMGREILQAPTVLIAAQPTWGVDAGAAAAIHQALLDLAKSGMAILIISQDLEELFAIATRIAVIAHGRVSLARAVEDMTVESIGLEMGGNAVREGAVHD